MTHMTRRIIFYIFVAIFVVTVPMIIFYALGYNFDFEKRAIVTTGGIYLKSEPTRAEVYLNDKSDGKTNKLIKRLSPKIYNVKITKENFYSWEKNLTVQPGLVTKADSILLPTNPKISLTTETPIKYFSLLPNKKELFYFASSSFYLYNIDNNQEKEVLQIDFKTPEFIWSNDNQDVIINSDKQYLMINVLDPKTIVDLLGIIKTKSKSTITNISNLNFDAKGGKIYFIANNNLYSLLINNKTEGFVLSEPLVQSVLNYAIYKNGIIYLDKTKGLINELDLTSLKSAQFFDRVFPSFNTGEWILSSDNKKLLCKKDKSVEILWLDNVTNNSIPRIKGDLDKIDFGQTINNILWYPKTDEHLIVSTDTSILFTELDNRLPRNAVNYITTDKPEIIYNSNNSILYFLSQNKLYQTEL